MSAGTDQLIFLCDSEALKEGGKGLRFPVTAGRDSTSGFAVRYRGVVRAYLNRCAHQAIELDWEEGEFFESTGSYLMCSTHGALYAPDSGRCEGGPCRGKQLRAIAVVEREGRIFWQADEFIGPGRDSSVKQDA